MMPIYYQNSQTGDDTNDGKTPQTAWKTMTPALRQAKAGDTLIVRRVPDCRVYANLGTYYESSITYPAKQKFQ